MKNLRPIRNKPDHDRAMAEIERLWTAKRGTRAHDRLEVLVTLVEVYERKHVALPPPDPVEAIRFRMEQQGLTRKDLEPLIGSRARVSEVLNRRRELTLPMIRALHRELGIPAESLIRPSRTG
jgi:HTH-type transcriptional regulator / antitoxin HigA